MGTSRVLRRIVLTGGICAATAGGCGSWMGAPMVAGAEVRNPKGVAVIIGNKDYEWDRVPEVSFARRDAEAFKRYVHDVLGFDPDNVIHLRNASLAQITATFGNQETHKGGELWSYLDGKKGSDVVVFYSGHGVPGQRDRRGYLLPVDANPDAVELNGYPIDLLYGNLGKLKASGEARTVRVFLDACFSGDSQMGMLIRSASPVAQSATPPRGTEGLTVLTASSGTQLASWDEEAGHGMFTHHLLDALYGKGDADGDGAVTAVEAKEYLDRHMTRAARRSYGREQDAGMYGEDGAVLSEALAGGGFPQRPALVREAGADGSKRKSAPVSRRAKLEGVSSAREVEESLGLDRAGRMAVQEGLAWLGKELGMVDGVFGGRTRGALRAWQAEKGLSETGYLTGEQAEALVALGREAREARSGRKRAGAEAWKQAETEERVRKRWKPGRKFRDCAECPELMVVPSGRYMMGSPRGEKGRFANEGPRHGVRISRPFAVGVNEVTRGEFGRFVSATGHSTGGACWTDEDGKIQLRSGRSWRDPGYSQGQSHPAVCVSWEDAQSYVDWLSSKTGESYRLLSESEWEYVARAGTDTRYFWGDSISENRANCDGCGSRWNGKRTAPVRSFEANGFGVYDLHGNVWEWVEDCWNDSYRGAPADGRAWGSGNCSRRVLRGGSWFNLPRDLRSVHRAWNETDNRSLNVGFRIARTLTP